MGKHYARRNQIARKNLKIAQNEVQVLKEEKDQASLDILAQASLQIYQDPWGTHLPILG